LLDADPLLAEKERVRLSRQRKRLALQNYGATPRADQLKSDSTFNINQSFGNGMNLNSKPSMMTQ
jgi:hypothetical protein